MTKVAISLPDDLAATLDRIAAYEGSSRSAIIAKALVPFLDRAMIALINSYVDEESDADRELTDAVVAASGDYFMKTP